MCTAIHVHVHISVCPLAPHPGPIVLMYVGLFSECPADVYRLVVLSIHFSAIGTKKVCFVCKTSCNVVALSSKVYASTVEPVKMWTLENEDTRMSTHL